eukprot:6191205-Pleurochrysis_carterae.AAC.4
MLSGCKTSSGFGRAGNISSRYFVELRLRTTCHSAPRAICSKHSKILATSHDLPFGLAVEAQDFALFISPAGVPIFGDFDGWEQQL